eukprot:COSAG01_NODE_20491_length_950_cov_3.428907_2_plen_22_part_01
MGACSHPILVCVEDLTEDLDYV